MNPWYKEKKQSSEKTQTSLVARCPVCKKNLGKRVEGEVTALPCYECDWVFVWEPGEEKPKPIRACKEKKCGCPLHS